MSSLFLDFENPVQVANFVHEQASFLPLAEQEGIGDRIAEAEKRPQALIALAREVATKSWPARQAVHQYAETQVGCEEEWRMVVGAVSKSTGHLLERFRHGTTCVSLDETLRHEEATSAFRDQELREIAAVRQHVREVLWRERQDAMTEFVDAAQHVFTETQRRIEQLRALATDTPWIEGEVFEKVALLEDQFLFEGTELSLERLDREIAYYREQKALPV